MSSQQNGVAWARDSVTAPMAMRDFDDQPAVMSTFDDAPATMTTFDDDEAAAPVGAAWSSFAPAERPMPQARPLRVDDEEFDETDEDVEPDEPRATLLERAQAYIQNMRAGEITGYGISAAIHLVIVLVLLGVKMPLSIEDVTTIFSSIATEPDKEQIFEAVSTDQIGTDSDIASLSAGMAIATELGKNPETQVREEVEEKFNEPKITLDQELEEPPKADFVSTVSVRGESTENVGGTEGAIDRLALEIQNSLRQRKTLAIWLFDASQSLKKRRDAIADRFENVYKQLDSLEPGTEKALKTVVATYGESFHLLTEKPVDDVRPLVAKVREIPNDESGRENVFSAVGRLAKQFQSYRDNGRNILLIIVTDERGDDVNYLDDAIVLCRKHSIKNFVVGNAALFGRETGYVMWTYPDGTMEELPVDAGPETVMPESLQLPFWGGRGPDLTRMSSGYGPYALTRLCKETGGLYLVAEEGRGEKFSPAIMRNYQPDYAPIKDYENALRNNKAKAALVMASTKAKVDNVPNVRLTFRADTDQVLKEEITESQRPIAEVDYKLNEMLTILRTGEKDRPKLTEPRWRAGYDLAMGRVLAMRVRAYGYNKMLAEMKAQTKSFANKGSNEWRLEPSKSITAGADVVKLAKEASTYLKRVIDEHPDTPWGMLAERELAMPMGWDWKEATGSYGSMGRDGPREKQIRLAEEEKKKKEASMKAAQRPKPKL